jgi:2-iminoacetate synthase ThiH
MKKIDLYFHPVKNKKILSLVNNIYIDISMVCNIRCRYCNIIKLQKYREVLTFDKFKVAFKNIEKMMKEILSKFAFDYENTGWNRK